MFQGYPVFLVGINDMRRVFHATSLSICSGETGDDYAFVFWSVKTMIDKLFFGEISTYRPTILIADGADAITNGFIMAFGECLIRIMCWAHVVRAVDKRLSVSGMKEYKDDIFADIYALQLSFSTVFFKYANGLFLAKWRSKNSEAINEFLGYFENEWLNINCGWYEGICHKTPSQDNGLEASNNIIKTHHTLRKRLPLGHYLGIFIFLLLTINNKNY
jgi:hypothetical protein